MGVLLLDADLRITHLNRAQLDVFRRFGVDPHPADLTGRLAAEAYPIFSAEEWEGIALRVVAGGETVRWSKLPCPRVNPVGYVAVDVIRLEADHGQRAGALCLTEDVTRGVALDRELIKKERLALVGQTAVALVHEISNPLAAVLGSAEVLLFSPSISPDVAKRIETIKLNALRVVEITRKLRELEDLQLTEYLQGGPIYITAEPRSS
ncbi:MAG: PAS domain-containing protein [Acidobacteria bacterium]|nr:PAS domain-containing protein [Acidobacteriota bacterium]